MEIEVAGPKAIAAIRRDRRLVGQQPASVIEHLQGARLLGLPAGRVMAAGHEDDMAIVRHRQHLMRDRGRRLDDQPRFFGKGCRPVVHAP